MLACFKVRAIPVNVNYRYVADELRHLYTDAGLVALIHHRAFADAVSGAIDAMAEHRLLLQVEDGSSTKSAPRSQEYEAALAAASPPDRWNARWWFNRGAVAPARAAGNSVPDLLAELNGLLGKPQR